MAFKQRIYQLDPDFAQLLFEQTNDLDIPSEIFLQLPYPCFYIEVPDLFFGAKPIHGFFVNLEYMLITVTVNCGFIFYIKMVLALAIPFI